MPKRLFPSPFLRFALPSTAAAVCVAFGLLTGSVLPAASAEKAARPNYDAERKDGEYGFRQEGMDFGRDPKTGDIYYQIDPPRPEATQTGQPPIIVYPEVDLGGRPRPYDGSGQSRPYDGWGQSRPYDGSGQARPHDGAGHYRPSPGAGRPRPYDGAGPSRPYDGRPASPAADRPAYPLPRGAGGR